MRLLEFRESNILMRDVVAALANHFDLERVGGDSRIYRVGDRSGVIFMLNNSLRALGLIYDKAASRLESVCVWTKIDLDTEPDFVADIPADADTQSLIKPLVQFIKKPSVGTITEGIVLESKREVSAAEFIQMAREYFGDRASDLTLQDLSTLAAHFNIDIPQEVRALRQGTNWNLADVEAPQEMDATDAVSGLRQGTVVLMGRKPNGELFEIPGVDKITAELDRLVPRMKITRLPDAPLSPQTAMEKQYAELEKKVRLVAGGEGSFIRSFLITGMPSAGKTFRVMQTIKEMGLKPGVDFVTKKGKISAKALYRVLIQQLNGMAIFDDCDSVVKDENGVNMLKGALDTDEVRTVDYDVQGLMNTDAMSFEARGRIVRAMSAILRGVPTEKEIGVIEELMGEKADRKQKAAGKPSKSSDPDLDKWLSDPMANLFRDEDDDDSTPEEGEDGTPRVTDMARIRAAEEFVMNNLPNKIDFSGRIIFISNMTPEEWKEVGDGAIITRAFTQNLAFPNNEMLDFIDKIKGQIKTPRLSEADKAIVLDFIRKLWMAGKVKKPINFRLVQSSFDLYLLNDWQSLVEANCQ